MPPMMLFLDILKVDRLGDFPQFIEMTMKFIVT
jgi:hypothetical protein